MRQIGELIEGQTLTVLDPDMNVRSAVVTMSEANIGAAAVIDAGVLAGIFSERDLMSRVVAKGLNPDDTSVVTGAEDDLGTTDGVPSEPQDGAAGDDERDGDDE